MPTCTILLMNMPNGFGIEYTHLYGVVFFKIMNQQYTYCPESLRRVLRVVGRCDTTRPHHTRPWVTMDNNYTYQLNIYSWPMDV